jgi:hypothetical protein
MGTGESVATGAGENVEIGSGPGEPLLSPQAINRNRLNIAKYSTFFIIYTFSMIFICAAINATCQRQ